MALTFVTGNAGKFREAQAVLPDLVQDTEGYTEVQADTLAEVAMAGSREVARRLDGPFFLEDAGLVVSALNGFPGVYSRYVLETVGLDGLLRLLEGKDRDAVFEAHIVHHEEGTLTHHVGRLKGTIAPTPRGEGGFGYDPIFVPRGHTRTLAQMSVAEKGAISHRGRALASLREDLRKAANN